MAEQLTAQQRAQLFALSTRQNYQMLPKETASQGATTLQFNLPKARLLSKLLVRVEGKVNVKHASQTSIKTSEYTPYKMIRRIALDLNNGFSPFVVSGEELAMYNAIDKNGDKVFEQTNYRNVVKNGTMTASSTGADNNVAFIVELPVTVNPRDPIGLILLQNDQTNVTLTVDIANGSDMFDDVSTSGYTINLSDIVVTPMLETFSIPANANAYPDLSVIKIVNGRTDSMASVGQQIIKLATGTIYRKLIFKIVDEDNNPVDDANLSDLELVFNQADSNYKISADMLRALNTKELGFELPKGCYCFDFSSGGNITNYGGTRDYIDTEKLTEFWLRFNSNVRGKVVIVSECLARLK